MARGRPKSLKYREPLVAQAVLFVAAGIGNER
jgi:hypothetical protein